MNSLGMADSSCWLLEKKGHFIFHHHTRY